MILIFSENNDWSTKKVLEYLYSFNCDFEVFTERDFIEFTYQIDSKKVEYKIFKNGSFLCLDYDIRSVWYRRLDVKVELTGQNSYGTIHEKEYAIAHSATRSESIENYLHKKKCLGVFKKGNYNKIEFIQSCIELGISIPKTVITDKKSDLEKMLLECDNEIIVKSLAKPYAFQVSDTLIYEEWKRGTTILINNEILRHFPAQFDLSLFQEKLKKKYELRVFYLNGQCFTQIIFSQSSESTNLDYRIGLGRTSSMRQCYYKLPDQILSNINRLMSKLNLNIGILDIVYTENDEYVFLEVNPSGQFGDASENTGLNFEYHIAKYLAS